MTAEEALQEIRTLLGLYPGMPAERVVDHIIGLRGDNDALDFTKMCLLAERISVDHLVAIGQRHACSGYPFAGTGREGAETVTPARVRRRGTAA